MISKNSVVIEQDLGNRSTTSKDLENTMEALDLFAKNTKLSMAQNRSEHNVESLRDSQASVKTKLSLIESHIRAKSDEAREATKRQTERALAYRR
jgi:hypothetical protein